MNKFLSQLNPPTILLYTFIVVGQITFGIYASRQADAPPFFIFIYTFGFIWIIGWWLVRDSRKRGIPLIFDLGFFLVMAWPLLVPYYLFKTRGGRGIAAILSFVAVYVAAFVVGVVLSLLVASLSS